MKENCLTLKKSRSIRYPVETITDADYVDVLTLLANTPAPVESLLHSPENVARGIGLYENLDKIEFRCLKQNSAISLNSKPLKSVDQFIYLGTNISSTESNVNKLIGKALTAIDRLSALWKSDNTKWEFFQAVAVTVLLYGCTTWTLMKHLEKR